MVVLAQAALSPSERALLPDAAAVAFFREHGWWLSPKCLSDELLDDALFGVERYYAGERDWPMLINVEATSSNAQQSTVRTDDYLSLQLMEFRNLIRHPFVPAMAACLAQTDEIRLFHDQLLFKPPSSADVPASIGWHTDKSYWHSCTSTNMISAWIPLQDTTIDMGSLALFDGSHRWPHRDDLAFFGNRDLGEVEASLRSQFGSAEPIVLEMARGQVSFHHCRTIHGSRANSSTKVRIACAIHYQDGENRYSAQSQSQGRRVGHMNDLLCRRNADNTPDYADPAICPRLWPATDTGVAASATMEPVMQSTRS